MLAATRLNPTVIVMRPDGRGHSVPCPEVDGYLVSATALKNPRVANHCDLQRYIDALEVSAVVIPGSSMFTATGAGVGDLAVAMRPGAEPMYAVVGDPGPAKEIGEVSIALAGRLLGKTAPPVNYDEIRGHGHWHGHGWDVPKTVGMVLPGTRSTAHPYLTQAAIDQAAAALFTTCGGAARLKACAALYRQR